MNEEQIRRIVKEEMAKNYSSGSPEVPPHQHNGIDNLQVSAVDIKGFEPTPSGNNSYQNRFMSYRALGFANLKVLKNPSFELEENIPVILSNNVILDNTSGLAGGFQGGYAPEGTIVFFQTPLTFYQLWARIGGAWRGIDLTLTKTDPQV